MGQLELARLVVGRMVAVVGRIVVVVGMVVVAGMETNAVGRKPVEVPELEL